MEIVIKAVVVGITAALVTLLLKKTNPEMSMLIITAASAAILFLGIELIGSLKSFIDMAAEVSGLSPAAVSPVLKCVGIAVISRVGTDLCRDAGASAVASSVELAAAGAALFVAMPLLQTLIQMIGELL